jgi:hypothetical protein
MLLALHIECLDRSADLFISAFEDSSENPSRLAARSRVQQAHRAGFIAAGPNPLPAHEHQFYRIHIAAGADGTAPLLRPRASHQAGRSHFVILSKQ